MIQTKHHNIPASYLALFQENKILLLRRFNTGYEDGKYSLIAGHVEPKENFTQCIIREAMEEAGIELKSKDLQMVHLMHRNARTNEHNERVDVFFIATTWRGIIKNMEPHKCNDLSWFDLNNLPKNLIPYVRQAIESIKNKIYYSEYGWKHHEKNS